MFQATETVKLCFYFRQIDIFAAIILEIEAEVTVTLNHEMTGTAFSLCVV